jgi:DNA-binding GntR family transcriptional regulator
MNKYVIDFAESEISKYLIIASKIKEMIDSNVIEDGEKLPSIRKTCSRLWCKQCNNSKCI